MTLLADVRHATRVLAKLLEATQDGRITALSSRDQIILRRLEGARAAFEAVEKHLKSVRQRGR